MLERDCPKGQEPIVWYLVTNEPIDTAEQVAEVVDAYRARWVIEEFFKALKTGCQIEKRQMESYEALRIALALFLPIAVRLLALRDAARTEPEQASSALTHLRQQDLERDADILRLVLRGLRRGLILHGPAVAPPLAAGRSSPSTYCVFARYFFAAALTRSDPTLSTNESKSRIPFGSSPNAYALLSSRSQ